MPGAFSGLTIPKGLIAAGSTRRFQALLTTNATTRRLRVVNDLAWNLVKTGLGYFAGVFLYWILGMPLAESLVLSLIQWGYFGGFYAACDKGKKWYEAKRRRGK